MKPFPRPLLAFILVAVVLISCALAGCEMPARADNLNTYSTSKSWVVSFDMLDGELSRVVAKIEGRPDDMDVAFTVESGDLTLEIQQGETVFAIPAGGGVIDVTGFTDGDIMLRIVGEKAQKGQISFDWN